MCGIVGATAQRNVVPILIEGLRKLEYRGYDSAGIALNNGEIQRVRFLFRRCRKLVDLVSDQHSDRTAG